MQDYTKNVLNERLDFLTKELFIEEDNVKRSEQKLSEVIERKETILKQISEIKKDLNK